jgi:hypothetical protein
MSSASGVVRELAAHLADEKRWRREEVAALEAALAAAHGGLLQLRRLSADDQMSASYQHARTWKVISGGKPKTIRFPAGYNWGGTYGTLETLRTTGIQTGTSPDGSGGLVLDGHPERVTNRRVTLVPDGVARVTVRLRGGRSVTVSVHDNVYRYTIRGVSADLGTVWFDAAGRRINHSK